MRKLRATVLIAGVLLAGLFVISVGLAVRDKPAEPAIKHPPIRLGYGEFAPFRETEGYVWGANRHAGAYQFINSQGQKPQGYIMTRTILANRDAQVTGWLGKHVKGTKLALFGAIVNITYIGQNSHAADGMAFNPETGGRNFGEMLFDVINHQYSDRLVPRDRIAVVAGGAIGWECRNKTDRGSSHLMCMRVECRRDKRIWRDSYTLDVSTMKFNLDQQSFFDSKVYERTDRRFEAISVGQRIPLEPALFREERDQEFQEFDDFPLAFIVDAVVPPNSNTGVAGWVILNPVFSE